MVLNKTVTLNGIKGKIIKIWYTPFMKIIRLKHKRINGFKLSDHFIVGDVLKRDSFGG